MLELFNRQMKSSRIKQNAFFSELGQTAQVSYLKIRLTDDLFIKGIMVKIPIEVLRIGIFARRRIDIQDFHFNL
jgi:hypothetical protein